MLGRGAPHHLLVGVLVLIPALALLEVAGAELPILGGVVEAGPEALGLLLLGDVQEELEDGRALVRQHLLEVADVGVAGPPARPRHQVVDPDYEHVLVVAARPSALPPSNPPVSAGSHLASVKSLPSVTR
jgi:hypothetical protein